MDFQYRLAYWTFGDIWTAVSFGLDITLEQIVDLAQEHKRRFVSQQREAGYRIAGGQQSKEELVLDKKWAEKLCQIYSIQVDTSGNPKLSTLGAAQNRLVLTRQQNIKVLQFFWHFLNRQMSREWRPQHGWGVFKDDLMLMQQHRIYRFENDIPGFALKDMYYPDTIGNYATFTRGGNRYYVDNIAFLTALCESNQFILSLQPSFLVSNIYKSINRTPPIDAIRRPPLPCADVDVPAPGRRAKRQKALENTKPNSPSAQIPQINATEPVESLPRELLLVSVETNFNDSMSQPKNSKKETPLEYAYSYPLRQPLAGTEPVTTITS
ncbi:hypothetical protein EYR41_006110 [Orbilia oligospora]|uniref:Uncharacterized protein n=1 Tax=Orbilia oligospora TaxID=2813651 RepID=A0A8H2HQA4_ORBOL|nr:hypothetical protein EYR41_006110 [Orbilia oligospora]